MKNCERLREKIVKHAVLGGRTTFEREKNVHGIFHGFLARLSATLCWRG